MKLKWWGALLIILALVAIGFAGYKLAQSGRVIEHYQSVTFEVLELPDFTLSVSAGPTVIPGQVYPLGVTITPNSSFAGEVEVELYDLPTGVQGTYFPASNITVGGGPASMQIDLRFPVDNSLLGPHTIRVRAVSTVYNGSN